MGAIEDVKDRLMASELAQHPFIRTRGAQDIIDECLAPFAAELEAAREAVEGWRLLMELRSECVILAVRSGHDCMWTIEAFPICGDVDDLINVDHDDLLEALRAAYAEKTELEKRDD